jgi:hypothetical protein
MSHERQRLFAFVSDHPAAAVDLEQDRSALDVESRCVHVEGVADAATGHVRNVLGDTDFGVTEPERIEMMRNPLVVLRARIEFGKNLRAVIRSQSGDERRLDDRLRMARNGHESQQTRPGGDRDPQAEPSRPRLESSRHYEEDRCGHLPREMVRRKL